MATAAWEAELAKQYPTMKGVDRATGQPVELKNVTACWAKYPTSDILRLGQIPDSKHSIQFWATALVRRCIVGLGQNTRYLNSKLFKGQNTRSEGTGRPAGNQGPYTVIGGDAFEATRGHKIQ